MFGPRWWEEKKERNRLFRDLFNLIFGIWMKMLDKSSVKFNLCCTESPSRAFFFHSVLSSVPHSHPQWTPKFNSSIYKISSFQFSITFYWIFFPIRWIIKHYHPKHDAIPLRQKQHIKHDKKNQIKISAKMCDSTFLFKLIIFFIFCFLSRREG